MRGVALVATLILGTCLVMGVLVTFNVISPVYGNCTVTEEGTECVLQGYVWGDK